jgi:D-glycero-D-manno-heptose 1,7-bisphosphate phosphatase
MTRKALFLDRDGVINVDTGYLHTAAECVFIDGIFDLVRRANDADYAVVVVTNQAGIGRGYYPISQFGTFTDWMQGEFRRRDAWIDQVYYCPHHPEAGVGRYKQACTCRKPQPGMLLRARTELDLEMEGSLMIGDNLSDLEAAQRAGVTHRFLFVPDGEPAPKLPAALGSRISRLSEVYAWLGAQPVRPTQQAGASGVTAAAPR